MSAPGSLSTFPCQTSCPSWSSTQTAVFCREMSRPTTLRMVRSLPVVVGCEPSGVRRLATDYPISRTASWPSRRNHCYVGEADVECRAHADDNLFLPRREI